MRTVVRVQHTRTHREKRMFLFTGVNRHRAPLGPPRTKSSGLETRVRPLRALAMDAGDNRWREAQYRLHASGGLS